MTSSRTPTTRSPKKMPNPNGQEPKRQHDAWVTIGMVVSATSAALTSFDGLRQLALAAGWADVMAPLLPATIDCFAATATRIWLAKSTGSERARRFSRACAIGAILLSLAGNAIYHLIAANLLEVTWLIVLGVGAIPPAILGLISHLAVLRTQQDTAPEDEPSTVLSPVLTAVTDTPMPEATQEKSSGLDRPRPTPKRRVAKPRRASTDDLLNAARAADAAHHAAHGRGITRDALRQELRIGGERATLLLRQLRATATATPSET